MKPTHQRFLCEAVALFSFIEGYLGVQKNQLPQGLQDIHDRTKKLNEVGKRLIIEEIEGIQDTTSTSTVPPRN